MVLQVDFKVKLVSNPFSLSKPEIISILDVFLIASSLSAEIKYSLGNPVLLNTSFLTSIHSNGAFKIVSSVIIIPCFSICEISLDILSNAIALKESGFATAFPPMVNLTLPHFHSF